jgi:hypothetical protein
MESSWELRDHTQCRLLNFYSSYSLTAVTYATEVAIPSISFPLDEKSLAPTITKRTHRQELNTYSITTPSHGNKRRNKKLTLPPRKSLHLRKALPIKPRPLPHLPSHLQPSTDAKLRITLVCIYSRQILEGPNTFSHKRTKM